MKGPFKVLPEHVASDPELKQRFELEAKTLAVLSHPHICPVFDVGSQNGIDFLVMEYLEDGTLENGSFLAPRRVELEHHALHGLQARIRHRDETLKVGFQLADPRLELAHTVVNVDRCRYYLPWLPYS